MLEFKGLKLYFMDLDGKDIALTCSMWDLLSSIAKIDNRLKYNSLKRGNYYIPFGRLGYYLLITSNMVINRISSKSLIARNLIYKRQ